MPLPGSTNWAVRHFCTPHICAVRFGGPALFSPRRQWAAGGRPPPTGDGAVPGPPFDGRSVPLGHSGQLWAADQALLSSERTNHPSCLVSGGAESLLTALPQLAYFDAVVW